MVQDQIGRIKIEYNEVIRMHQTFSKEYSAISNLYFALVSKRLDEQMPVEIIDIMYLKKRVPIFKDYLRDVNIRTIRLKGMIEDVESYGSDMNHIKNNISKLVGAVIENISALEGLEKIINDLQLP